MLPVTHGERYTRRHVLLYTMFLFVVSLLPFSTPSMLLVSLGLIIVLQNLFVLVWGTSPKSLPPVSSAIVTFGEVASGLTVPTRF